MSLKKKFCLASLALNPYGHLRVIASTMQDVSVDIASITNDKLVDAFSQSQESGLFALLTADYDENWSKGLKFWRNFVEQYAHSLCRYASDVEGEAIKVSLPDEAFITSCLARIPPISGGEHCSESSLKDIWLRFDAWISQKIEQNYSNLSAFLAKELPSWQPLGRVCFHLAENKQDQTHPFAFMASYAVSLNNSDRVQYKPLGKALQEYAGNNNKQALAHLLEPISHAAKQCAWLNSLVENHDIYHPLKWSIEQAYQLLKSVPVLEAAGLLVKLPNWWKKRRQAKVQVTIDTDKKNHFSAEALLHFSIDLALDGEPLSQDEIDEIMSSEQGLVLLKGQWIEVDKDKLGQALAHWESVAKDVGNDGLSFVEGMRLLAGADHGAGQSALDEDIQRWCGVQAGKEIKQVLDFMQNPSTIEANTLGQLLHANLREYQQVGLAWLDLLSELGLGACLADDMGLGKTIQIIALVLLKKKRKTLKSPCLLVLPASLLANWHAEIAKFAPSISSLIFHGSTLNRSDIDGIAQNPMLSLSSFDLVITTYGTLLRQECLLKMQWHLIIVDEAQAIKNPSSRQTRLVKQLKGAARIALTGTPIENRLGDLWSLFDFICPGLLGDSKQFKQFIKSMEQSELASFAPLRQLVSPYILRRLKTDKRIISDLPDKSELDAWCGLTKIQAKLYSQSVNEMAKALQDTNDGIKRRGLVLAYLTRFKQICNHPSQLLGDMQYIEQHSGKFSRLREICEEIASRQEKVLVFTQYREMTGPLTAFLADIFADPGLCLHGGTPVKKRKQLVDDFQSENGSPFFVLSLKAAGTGLNLTAASHVIHFDRWWNPAVENQATDRAYRIGQRKNVLVHKFICRGTVEEKINIMIEDKKVLANGVLGAGAEIKLTEMNNDELLRLVALDINQLEV